MLAAFKMHFCMAFSDILSKEWNALGRFLNQKDIVITADFRWFLNGSNNILKKIKVSAQSNFSPVLSKPQCQKEKVYFNRMRKGMCHSSIPNSVLRYFWNFSNKYLFLLSLLKYLTCCPPVYNSFFLFLFYF